MFSPAHTREYRHYSDANTQVMQAKERQSYELDELHSKDGCKGSSQTARSDVPREVS